MCNTLHLDNSVFELSSSLATMSLLPWVTWGRHEIDHISSSGIQLKNNWSYNSTPHMPSWHTQGWTEHQFPPPPTTIPIGSPPSLAIHITHINHTHIQQFVTMWAFISDCLALKMRVMWSFRTPGTTHPTRRCYITEDWYPQQHCCKTSHCFLESVTIQWWKMDEKLGS
jgi:hypothetical protein